MLHPVSDRARFLVLQEWSDLFPAEWVRSTLVLVQLPEFPAEVPHLLFLQLALRSFLTPVRMGMSFRQNSVWVAVLESFQVLVRRTEEGNVLVVNEAGKRFRVPFSRFSALDQKYIEKAMQTLSQESSE